MTHYNNFYEFGTGKNEPARNAQNFKTSPWTVSVEGDVAKPRKFALDEILKLAPLEERIYRHRCVEAWSIVVPWIGYSLSALLKQVQPTAKAKYVAFESYCDPKQMPLARPDRPASSFRTWKGCAWMKPCTRWRCCASACTARRCRRRTARRCAWWCPGSTASRASNPSSRSSWWSSQPPTTWNMANAHEYGFYSNVNPDVDHPRWSQAKEQRLPGEFREPPHPDVQRLRRPGGRASTPAWT